MFVAINTETNGRVTSLDSAWLKRCDELRDMANSGRIACPECDQLLRFRAGMTRRPHFAHRTLSDCPLSRHSSEFLEAQAQLYDWLCTKYPGKVELDIDQGIPGWESPAALVVCLDASKSFAYWIFDKAPRNRSALAWHVRRNDTAHVLFMVSSEKLNDDHDELLLSAAQRDFVRKSFFDNDIHLGHLHYLDTGRHQVKIYRNLDCVHSPNCFAWSVDHVLDWQQCKISPRTGEIVAEDDREREAEHYAPVAERALPYETHPIRAKFAPSSPNTQTPAHRMDQPLRSPVRPLKPRLEPTSSDWLNRPLTCTECGKIATNYPSCKPSEGTCVCYDCHEQYALEQYKKACQKIREP